MKTKIGLILILAGIAMFGTSMYIEKQVLDGRDRISSAQRKVDRGKGFLDTNPVVKDFSDQLTAPFQKKIDSGRRDADYYEVLATSLRYGGIASFVVGLILLILPRRKKR